MMNNKKKQNTEADLLINLVYPHQTWEPYKASLTDFSL